MLRKQTTQRGFTIIEVVITIAIGAAVMALVLNAVAGARRSQRNNARNADVSSLASAINQYIATRNQLPANVAAIKSIADDFTKLGHYDEAQINAVGSWASMKPAAGSFAWDTAFDTAPTNSVNIHPTQGKADYIVVINKGNCSDDVVDPVTGGGIREVAIVYSLEGQDSIFCLEV